jgi:hypothetical protein
MRGFCVVVVKGRNTQLVCKVGLVSQLRKAVFEEGALGKEGAKEHLRRKERPGRAPGREVRGDERVDTAITKEQQQHPSVIGTIPPSHSHRHQKKARLVKLNFRWSLSADEDTS